MQTILGAGGAIGVELAKALPQYTTDIRLVSRNPQAINSTDTVFPADLTDAEAVQQAVEGSEMVYLTVGLPYKTKVWQATWPVIMQNVLAACKTHQAKLIFFDNIYMYDPAYLDRLTDETPIKPPSKKGAVRAQIAQMVWDAVERGEVEALIARAADFYGPSIKGTSVLTETVFTPLTQGQKANWLGSVDRLHAFTYTPDAAQAIALLGNTPEAFNQVWHLPTAKPLSGKAWIEAIAAELGVEPKYQVAPKWMVRVMGLFMPVMGELVEMVYQYERDYVFDSQKFETRFKVAPTPVDEGIKTIVQTDYAKS